MPRVLISKHEYGPDSHKGALKDIPAPGYERLVHAYARCPKCSAPGFTLRVQPMKGVVCCTACDASGSIYEYVNGTADLTESVEFGWDSGF